MINEVNQKFLHELKERTHEIFSRFGFGESTSPDCAREINRLFADLQSLLANNTDTILRYRSKVANYLDLDNLPGVSSWVMPKASLDIIMLGNLSSVINQFLTLQPNALIHFKRSVDAEIETNLNELRGVITRGTVNGSSFQWDRVYPPLLNLCKNFACQVMIRTAETQGLPHLQEQLMAHSLLKGPLSNLCVAYMQPESLPYHDPSLSNKVREFVADNFKYRAFEAAKREHRAIARY